MSTKTGSYPGSGKNPLSETSINENGDKGDRTPKFEKDFAGGLGPSKKIDADLKYSGGNSGYEGK